MPSPFPCGPVIRECLWKKTEIEKKNKTNVIDVALVSSLLKFEQILKLCLTILERSALKV